MGVHLLNDSRDSVSPNSDPLPRYLDIREFAVVTKLSASTIRRLVKAGSIKAIQPGGKGHRMLFRLSSLEQSQMLPDRASEEKPTAKTPSRPASGPRPRWKQG